MENQRNTIFFAVKKMENVVNYDAPANIKLLAKMEHYGYLQARVATMEYVKKIEEMLLCLLFIFFVILLIKLW